MQSNFLERNKVNSQKLQNSSYQGQQMTPKQKEDHFINLKVNLGIPKKHVDYLKELSKDPYFNPKIIYDIGSCVLHWTREAEQIWPNSEVILFEAMSEIEFLYNGYNYHIGLLSDKSNITKRFYKNLIHPGGNSYYKENDDNVFPENIYDEMTTKTLTEVVNNRNFPLPDLVKMDVQGSELDIIKGGIDIINNAKYLICEFQHEDYNKDAPKNTECIEWLENNGWKCIAYLFSQNGGNGPDGDYCFINKTKM